MTLVLHVLPHPGGGGERYVDVLGDRGDRTHRRVFLSPDARPATLLTSAPRGVPQVRHAIAGADIVHVHGDMAAVLALPLLRGATWAWTTHGLHFRRRGHAPGVAPAFDAGLRRALGSAAATICTSEAERDELRPLARSSWSRVSVIHNGVAVSAGRTSEGAAGVRERMGIGEDSVVAVFLAALEPHKGADVAIDAVGTARARGADVTLVVAGTGSQDAELRARAGDGVRFAGHVAAAELLAGGDIFVLPSEREGLSLALLEAMEAGLAPVVSDGPGNPEAVGDAGVVVPVGDVGALTSALVRLTGDADDRERLGAAARDRAHTLFSLERFAAQTSAVYDALLTAPGRGAGAAPA